MGLVYPVSCLATFSDGGRAGVFSSVVKSVFLTWAFLCLQFPATLLAKRGDRTPLIFSGHGVGGQLLSSMVGEPSPQTSPL